MPVAFQETDLMAGIQYFLGLADRLKKPLILCIGLGTIRAPTPRLPLSQRF